MARVDGESRRVILHHRKSSLFIVDFISIKNVCACLNADQNIANPASVFSGMFHQFGYSQLELFAKKSRKLLVVLVAHCGFAERRVSRVRSFNLAFQDCAW